MKMNGISTKVSAATIGAAAATLVWTLLAAFVTPIKNLDPNTLATVTGTTAALLGAILGYFTKETASVPDYPTPVEDGFEPTEDLSPPPTFG